MTVSNRGFTLHAFRSRCSAIVAIAVTTTALVAGCGASEDGFGSLDDSGEIPTHRYSGPGSFYQATIEDDGGFSIDVSERFGEPALMSIAGDYTRRSTGFLELVVRDVVSTSTAAPSAGVRAYALELPGFAMFLNPAGSNEVIPMLTMDACPTQSFSANWIMIRGEDGRDATHPDREWFGTFDYTHATMPEARIPARYNLSQLSELLDAPAAIEATGCQNGHLPVFEGSRLTANMWLTDGGAIVETLVADGTSQTLVAMRQRAVTVSDVAGDYAALFVGEEVQAGTVSFDANGAGQAVLLADPGDPQTVSSSVTMSLGTAGSNLGLGWLAGSISGTGAGNLACSVLPAAGQTARTVLVCIGQDPEDVRRPISVLMASTP